MRCLRTIRLATALFLSLTACARSNDASVTGEDGTVTLSPITTVRLIDSDTAFLGKPNSLAVSATGDIFVTDLMSRRVLRYDASGAFVQTIGRRGGGPNEFEGPVNLTSLDDSTLIIVDILRRRAVLWDLPSNSVRTRLPIPGLTSRLVSTRGTLYAAAADVEHGTAGLRWRVPAGEPERIGTMLAVYRDLFFAIWGEVAMDASGDSILHFGGPSEYMIVADSMWQPRDSMAMPRRARRGIPREIDYDVSGGRNIYDVSRQLSKPFGLHHLSAGRFAAFHLDARIINNSVFGRVFMTVISAAAASRCIDVPIPSRDTSSIPRLSFIGDTMFVLDQYVVADSAIADVSTYVIGPDLC
jgi:hypothetical protein